MKAKQAKWLEVEKLPLDVPPAESWSRALNNSRQMLPCPGIYAQLPGLQAVYKHHLGLWEIVLHQVYKMKWNPKHRLPQPNGQRHKTKSIKPFAEVILAWLNLCEALHTLGAGSNYRNAGEWFQAVCNEINSAAINGLVANSQDGHLSIFIAGNSRALASAIQSTARDPVKNPFNKESNPAQWEVINEASMRYKSHPLIYSNLLKGRQRQQPQKGLVVALSAFETALAKKPSIFLRPDGSLALQVGRGKDVVKIKP